VKSDIGGTVTIFQKIDKGFLRISTNVKQKNGNRAVGTYIPNSSPVAQTVMTGETYYGRAFVVTDWYLTAYEPILINGSIEGILYVGIPEKEIEELKTALTSLQLLGNGKIACVDTTGHFIINPLFEDSIASLRTDFLKHLKGKKDGQFDFQFKGQASVTANLFRYYKPFEWYIIANFDKEEIIAGSLSELQWIMITALVFLIGIISVLMALTMNRIMKPLQNVSELMSEISEGAGDLTQRITVSSNDEIGELSIHFNRFMEKLSELISAIRDNALILASSTTELSVSVNVITSKSADLMTSSHHTASAVEEMSATINHISDNTQQAYHDVEEGARDAAEGQSAVDKMIESIKFIESLSNESSVSANELSVKMTRIGDILTVINDITNRTNLLALNATIQAARAGENGKGFQIVAEEIKKLSEKTKDQTKIIEDLIKKITTETQQVVHRMDTMNVEVGKGVTIAEETGNKFKGIVSKVSSLKNSISMTVSATKQQSATTADIALQAESVKRATQESSQGLEQSTIAVQETANIATRLMTLVEEFKLDSRVK
jgi:methyl-accepting chemotaxis protein